MKRILALMIPALLLTGCMTNKLPTAVTEEVPTEPTVVVETPKADAAHYAFRELLETMHDTGCYPTELGLQEIELNDGYIMDYESFALTDLDGDGEDELIIEIRNTYTAGQALLVYNWNEQTRQLHNTLDIPPYAKFFENGNIQGFWSHNQGLAGEALWPYTWYEYDKAADSYASKADVDAWDRSFAETDYEGNPFPEEVDTDGAGVVYQILTREGMTTLSRSAFLAWETPLLTRSPERKLPWREMTAENIAAVAANTAEAENILERSDFLWRGQKTPVLLKVGETGITVFRQGGTEEKLVTAPLPRLLGMPAMTELDITDLNGDGYSDLNVIIAYPDGSSAVVLWLSSENTLYYNEEFSVLPGDISPRGEE